MKKILSTLLAVLMLGTSVTPVPVYASGSAQESTKIIVESVVGDIDNPATADVNEGEIDVDISISGNPGTVEGQMGISGLEIKVNYDSEYASLAAVNKGDFFSDDAVSSIGKDLTKVPFSMGWTDAEDEDGVNIDGVLATLTFEVIKAPKDGKIPVEVIVEIVYVPDPDDFNNLIEITPSVVNGSISMPSYKIIFDPNGGSAVTPENVTAYKGSTYGELPTTTRTGYEFAGWYTTASSGGTKINAEDSVALTADTTIYARWNAIESEVLFDANGGTVSQASKIVTYDETYGTLPIPVLDGYSFVGWFTAAEGGNEVTSTDTVKITEGITLYAHWVANDYLVTFDPNGGSVDPDSKEFTYDSAYKELPEAEREGYAFDGWFTSKDGGNQIKEEDTVDITAPTTFFAHWTANKYNVNFDANGGSVTPSSTEVTYDSAYGELPVPTYAGYDFVGWFTAAEGGNKVTSTDTVKITEETTLYAHWEAKKFTVTFNANGGSVSPESKSVSFGSEYGTLPTPTYPGYGFDGWFTAAEGGELITSATVCALNENQTLYAHWTAGKFTVSFDGNGGAPSVDTKSVINDEAYGELASATRYGYSFDGWFTSVSGGEEITASTIVSLVENQTLFAHWTANKYTVSFDANGGEVTTESKEVTFDSEYGDLPVATREGYNFVGWYTAAELGVCVESSDIVDVADNDTLYAQWIAKSYTVTFDANGGSVDTESKAVAYDGPYGELPEATREGYSFDGWFTDAENGSEIEVNYTVKITDNTTLYAHWTAEKYNVIFNANGGTVSPESKEVTYDSAYGELPTPTREGYAFNGWFTEAESGNEVKSEDIVKVTSETTVYAHWTANEYTVTFNANSGTVTPENKAVIFDSAYGTLPTPVYEGYAFDGWYADQNFGSLISSASIVNTADNHTVYAKWVADAITITFDANGGVSSVDSKALTAGDAIGTLPVATRENYTFDKWLDAQGNVVEETTTFDADATLTAAWIADSYTVTYDANGGSGAPESQTKQHGTALTLSTVKPTRSGYTFAGWATTKDATTAEYQAGGSYELEGNATLFAVWTKKASNPTRPTGGTTSKPTTGTTTPTTPTTPSNPDSASVNRLSGDTRYDTAAAISSAAFKKADTVIIASGVNYADALAGVPLAYALNAPILIVSGDKVDKAINSEIARLGAKNVYILGGTSAVSESIAKELGAKYNVVRVSGDTRYETSVEIAKLLRAKKGTPSEIFVAYSANYPDALAISPVAAMNGCPIVFADNTGKLNSAVADFIKTSGCSKVTILGGTAVIPKATEDAIKANGISTIYRLGGADRYATMLLVNKTYASLFTGDGVCVATGDNYPDALTGGVFAAVNKMPIVLVKASASANGEIAKYIDSKGVSDIYVFGGKNAVSDAVVDALAK